MKLPPWIVSCSPNPLQENVPLNSIIEIQVILSSNNNNPTPANWNPEKSNSTYSYTNSNNNNNNNNNREKNNTEKSVSARDNLVELTLTCANQNQDLRQFPPIDFSQDEVISGKMTVMSSPTVSKYLIRFTPEHILAPTATHRISLNILNTNLVFAYSFQTEHELSPIRLFVQNTPDDCVLQSMPPPQSCKQKLLTFERKNGTMLGELRARIAAKWEIEASKVSEIFKMEKESAPEKSNIRLEMNTNESEMKSNESEMKSNESEMKSNESEMKSNESEMKSNESEMKSNESEMKKNKQQKVVYMRIASERDIYLLNNNDRIQFTLSVTQSSNWTHFDNLLPKLSYEDYVALHPVPEWAGYFIVGNDKSSSDEVEELFAALLQSTEKK